MCAKQQTNRDLSEAEALRQSAGSARFFKIDYVCPRVLFNCVEHGLEAVHKKKREKSSTVSASSRAYALVVNNGCHLIPELILIFVS